MISSVETKMTQIEKVIPATPSQIEIWLACKLGGKDANKAYNESVSVNLKGFLNVPVLQKAFSKVVERHEAMRAVISPNGKSFLIFSNYSLPIRMRDFSGLDQEEKKRCLQKHTEQTGEYDFNLIQGPLYVLDLIKLDEFTHLLSFTGHHIVFDGWSLSIMLEELSFYYSRLVVGENPSLPEANRLGEYAQEFFNLTRKSSYKRTKEFWKTYLNTPVPKFELPADNTLPSGRSYAARRIEKKFSKEALAKSKAFGAKIGASLNLTLLAIFEMFLSNWTKQNDIIVGLPVSGQLGLNKHRLISHCVNLLPLRTIVNPNETFVDYLTKRKDDYFQVMDHSYISFGEMIKDIPLSRNASRIPLVPVTFNIDTNMGELINFHGLEHQLISNPKRFSNFEIILNLFESSDGPVFEWTYNTELFSQTSIEKAAEVYCKAIEIFLESPNERLNNLFKVLNIESRLISPTSKVFIGSLIKKNLLNGGDKTAVCIKNDSITYLELNDKVDCIAGHLLAKGVAPGMIVGVHQERSIDLVATALAIIAIGACYMPIDSEYPEDRVKFMLEDVNVKVFITDNDEISWNSLENRKLKIEQLLTKQDISDFQLSLPKSEDPLLVVYTSGSTGTPKGVALSQQNLLDFLVHFSNAPGYIASDRVLGLSSISFDMSFMELVLPFVFGASLHLFDKFERRDSREIVKVLNSGHITKLFATPSHLKSILDHGLENKLKQLTVISAGEPLHRTLASSLVKVAGKVFNIYGPTETTIFTNIKEITSELPEITIGKPVEGTTIILIDNQGEIVSSTEELGEIYIGGKGVGLGYLNRNELNRERFIESPLPSIPGRFYRTGDLAVWTTDGELICKGRIDHQVKIRGQRVELSEIESKIAEDENVEHVIVEKTVSDDGTDRLIALISFKEGREMTLNSEKWIISCKEKLNLILPSFMIPSSFVFVENFELNQNGKVDRKLARKFIPTTDSNHSDSFNSDLNKSPSQFTSTMLQIWNEFLDVKENQLDSDFFQMGGHSLMAVDLISKIEKRFNLDLPLSILFEYSTINSLSRRIEQLASLEGENSSILTRLKEGDPDKVLFFVHGVGLNPIEIKTLNDYMEDGQTIWGLQSPSIQNTKTKPIDNLQEIAGLYISEIKKIGFSGNFMLLGNSFGGQIAFEMARQLIAAGEKVSFLGMIDTVASLKHDNLNSVFGNLSHLTKKMMFEIRFLLDDPHYYYRYRIDYLKEKLKSFNYNKTGVEKQGLKYRISQIEKVNLKAWESYEHEYVDTKLTLFLAEKRTFFVSDFKTFGWSNLVNQIEIIYMPGDHANMLKPPYGQRFSQRLQNLLNN